MDSDSNGTINDDEFTEFDHDPRERRKSIKVPVEEQLQIPIEDRVQKATGQ